MPANAEHVYTVSQIFHSSVYFLQERTYVH